MSIFLTNLPSKQDNVNMENPDSLSALRPAMAGFFHAYQAFTAGADRMLAERGLARMHHRILFFVAYQPGLSVGALLALLGVSKQALNLPLRQLTQAGLIEATPAAHDRRVKSLQLTDSGRALEAALCTEQQRLLGVAAASMGEDDARRWQAFNRALAGAREN